MLQVFEGGLKYGHKQMNCKFVQEPICGRCAGPQHADRERKEKCTENSYCVNCESDDPAVLTSVVQSTEESTR